MIGLLSDPLVEFVLAESPCIPNLECRDFLAGGKPVNGAFIYLEVGSNIFDGQDLIHWRSRTEAREGVK